MWSLALAVRSSILLESSCFASLMPSFFVLGAGLRLWSLQHPSCWPHVHYIWSLLGTLKPVPFLLQFLNCTAITTSARLSHHSWPRPKAFPVHHGLHKASTCRGWTVSEMPARARIGHATRPDLHFTLGCLPSTSNTSGTTMNPYIVATGLAALLILAHPSGIAPDCSVP